MKQNAPGLVPEILLHVDSSLETPKDINSNLHYIDLPPSIRILYTFLHSHLLHHVQTLT